MHQFICPAKPKFTEDNLNDLEGKVIIVTGSNTGLGKEIARIVYSKNAKVYMMARSEEKTRKAMQEITEAEPKSSGELHFIRLDLSDLATIKTSAEEFLRQEQKLDILFNNAGVGYPDKGSKTKQGYELQLGVNCVGTFALTKLLTPVLASTARAAPTPGSVRVVWVSSSAAEGVSPKDYVERLGEVEQMGQLDQYSISKLGNYLHAAEFAARHRADGIISNSLNPGALDSDFWRSQGTITTTLLRKTLLHPPVYGAYTSLFAGFSPEVTMEKSGLHVAPWGQLWKVSKDMVDATKSQAEGGAGTAQKFWEWSEAQVKAYL
ncbi:hypothetical protein BX600DRAFT_418388 [Xylariales sp. PMI_506]|nr:hypothetical protein BX600DRAFT_418388 [Xylariales sp. PMI_506]